MQRIGTFFDRENGFQSGVSRHHQLYLQLLEAIRSGKFTPGDRLPAEAELCASYGVSRVTVQKAMERLVAEKLVTRQRGRGSFVRGNGGSGDMQELLENVERIMSSTRGRILALGPVHAFGQLVPLFGASAEPNVLETVHIRTKNGVPIGMLWSYTPLDFARFITRQAAVKLPAAVLIKQAGHAIGEAEQVITAAIADAELSASLQVPVGFPLLKIERTLFNPARHPLEHLVALYRSDYYALRMRLSPTKGGTEHWSVHSFD